MFLYGSEPFYVGPKRWGGLVGVLVPVISHDSPKLRIPPYQHFTTWRRWQQLGAVKWGFWGAFTRMYTGRKGEPQLALRPDVHACTG
jgi:hypothetical protein